MSTTEMSLSELKGSRQVADDVYDDGYLRVEHKNYYVACGGQTVKLPRTEFLILSRLARSPERIVRAEELWESAWGSDKPVNMESLHVYIYPTAKQAYRLQAQYRHNGQCGLSADSVS